MTRLPCEQLVVLRPWPSAMTRQFQLRRPSELRSSAVASAQVTFSVVMSNAPLPLLGVIATSGQRLAPVSYTHLTLPTTPYV